LAEYNLGRVGLVIKGEYDNTGGLSLGETSGTAYRGDRGKVAYDYSQNASDISKITMAEANSMDLLYEVVTGEIGIVAQVALNLGYTVQGTALQDKMVDLYNQVSIFTNKSNYPMEITAIQRTGLMNSFWSIVRTKAAVLEYIAKKRVGTQIITSATEPEGLNAGDQWHREY